jgi:hypothetical protein
MCSSHPPSLPPGTYDLILTNSAGSSDPWPIEYIDCEGCPPDPTVVAVFPGAALPGATIQIVGTNLTGATVTMCGDPVAIVSNDGNIITVVVPPGCPDGPPLSRSPHQTARRPSSSRCCRPPGPPTAPT